jgi:chromosome segregation ATPase
MRRLETERDDILHKLESSNASFTVKEAAMWQEKEKLDSKIHKMSTECDRLESHDQDLDSQLKETQAKCKSSEVELASAIADRDDLRSRLDVASSELKSNAAEVKS